MQYLNLAVLVLGLAIAAPAVIHAVPQDGTSTDMKNIGRDFEALLRPNAEFIGAGSERLKVHLSSVAKDRVDANLYHVTGWSEIKANRYALDGTITLTKMAGTKGGSSAR